MGLHINNSEKTSLYFAMSDETTKRVSEEISKLAIGLTPKQFCDAVELALSSLNQSIVLSIQPDPAIDSQD